MRFVPRRRPVPSGLPLALFLALFLALSCAAPARAGHGAPAGGKAAILVVAFGTSVPEARKAFDDMDAAVRQAFPGMAVHWAFTSNIIREKLAAQGQVTDSVPTALARLLDAGVTRLAVQSLHAIPGEEFHEKLVRTVRGFGGFDKVVIGQPLMSTDEDMAAVADALLSTFGPLRAGGEALVFMGHGTHHPANIYYPGLQWYLDQRDPLALVGTVEGTPSLEWVVARLAEKGVSRALLVPLMSVAGDHARNDMAGDEDDSWKSVLAARGIAARPVLQGLAEFAPLRELWLEHLRRAVAGLDGK